MTTIRHFQPAFKRQADQSSYLGSIAAHELSVHRSRRAADELAEGSESLIQFSSAA
jgi:hypothetical protein